MVGHFETALEGVVADPAQRISELALLTEAERHKLLVEWNATEAAYPADKTLVQLFEEQVERSPEAVAVEYEGTQLTYRELNARANQLAHYLQSKGVGPESRVGIWMERSPGDDGSVTGDAQGWWGICAAGSELSAGAPILHAG